MEDNFQNAVSQESTKNATVVPLFERNLAEIEQQLAVWDQQYGSEIISQWLFDIAFHRLYQANGFEFANSQLTEMRYALKRAEGPTSLGWIRRCKKASELREEAVA